MKQKGSMTAAMSLMLLLLLSLMAACLQASRTACARVQAVNGVDTGLYSLFSEYDRELLEEYHLFFLNAGYETGKLNLSQVISRTEHYMKPVLSTGLTKCAVQTCGIEGYRLASDRQGEAVEQQMIRYMKKNLGNAGLEALKSRYKENQEILNGQQEIKSQGFQETDSETAPPMEGISEQNNPLEIIRQIREYGFLGLVLPAGVQVSGKVQQAGCMLSERSRENGIGGFQELERTPAVTDKLLIQEYILENFSTFAETRKQGGLDYQVEYILGGKNSDKENLSYVVNRLLLVREASNIAFLYTDGQKRAELEACASALSLLLLIPEGMVLVQGVLAAGWAYIESLSDVKQLLAGGRVPLVKTGDSWKTQLGNLNLDSGCTDRSGMDYEEYLRLLLPFFQQEKLVKGAMDMMELNLRQIPGKEAFSLDSCIDALSVSFQIKGPENKIWQADRMYTYDM